MDESIKTFMTQIKRQNVSDIVKDPLATKRGGHKSQRQLLAQKFSTAEIMLIEQAVDSVRSGAVKAEELRDMISSSRVRTQVEKELAAD